LTFIGSVSPIVFQSASPVFIDANRSTWNMDPDLLANELGLCESKGKLPKAVIPTDLYGQCADYDKIQEVCDYYSIPFIIDAAESLGAEYKNRKAGVAGRASIFSFNGNKIITTSGGGMLASNDKKIIDHARKLSQQAREPFPHYEHMEIGYNYRMSNILAAIGRGQLQVLDERVKRKRHIFEYYKNSLSNISGIEFMPEAAYGKSNRWLTVILITPQEFGDDREKVRLALEIENIESRPVWKPMHLQPVFKMCRCVEGGVAGDLFRRGLCLPSGTAMTEEDLNRVVKVILSCRR
jgi:dTDP-4-amino-4,6-dideoxygalactose transaminase